MTKRSTSSKAREQKGFTALVAFLFRSPLQGLISRRLILLTFIRRTAIRSMTIVVSYVKDGNTLLVTDNGFWQKNLSADMDVRVQWHGKEQLVGCDVIKATAELVQIIRAMMTANRALRRFIDPLSDHDGQPAIDQDALS